MRNSEFTSWLAGFFLVCEPDTLVPDQQQCVLNHAKLCEYTEKGRLTITNYMIRHNLSQVPVAELREHVLVQFDSVPCPSSEELCYFLQGVFEIDGKTEWSRGDARIVNRLLDRNVWGLAPPLIKLYYDVQRFLESDAPTFDMTHV